MLHTEFLLNQQTGVTNAHAAKEWMRELPLSDARAAHHMVAGLMAELEDSVLPPLDRLEILETLRPSIAGIDKLYAGRYTAKPLPLGPAERNAFEHAKRLWLLLEEAYMRCAEAALHGDAALQAHLALALTRACCMAVAALNGHVRAGQAYEDIGFDRLQRYFEIAREHGALSTSVADRLHPNRATSVAAVYRRALLIRQGAGCAGGRERECVIDLAEAWEAKTSMRWVPTATGQLPARGDPPPGAEGLRQCVKVLHAGRWIHMLDVTLVSRSLRRRMHKVTLGAKAEELRLPESFNHAGIEDLLKRLHSAWCEEAHGRAHTRLLASAGASARENRVTVAQVAEDFGALHYLVTGVHFDTGDAKEAIYNRRHAEEMFMFGHAARAKEEAHDGTLARQFEDWEMMDESAGGYRLRRAGIGARLRRGQLVALRVPVRELAHAKSGAPKNLVLLAEIRWLAEPVLALEQSMAGLTTPGAVEAGLQILHGKLAGVGVRPTGVNAQGGRHFHPAFLLRVSQAGESGFRLVTPAGWFKPRRVVEVREGAQSYRVMLEKLIHRGADFEMVEAYMTN